MTYQYQVGEWYKTRGGFEAQVEDVHIGMSILGKIKIDQCEEVCNWKGDGCYHWAGRPHEFDLLPPVERKELWVNVNNSQVCYFVGPSRLKKDEADEYACPSRIGMIRIVIEGDDFTVEKVTG